MANGEMFDAPVITDCDTVTITPGAAEALDGAGIDRGRFARDISEYVAKTWPRFVAEGGMVSFKVRNPVAMLSVEVDNMPPETGVRVSTAREDNLNMATALRMLKANGRVAEFFAELGGEAVTPEEVDRRANFLIAEYESKAANC
jgi:hypothetical protein